MSRDNHLVRMSYGMGVVLAASLALLLKSLPFGREDAQRQCDDAWLASVRAQGW